MYVYMYLLYDLNYLIIIFYNIAELTSVANNMANFLYNI